MTSRVSRTGVGIATLLAVVLAACGSTTSAAIPRTFYGMVPETTLTSQDFTKMKEAGVGSLRDPRTWLSDGDEIVISSPQLGVLETHIAAPS